MKIWNMIKRYAKISSCDYVKKNILITPECCNDSEWNIITLVQKNL